MAKNSIDMAKHPLFTFCFQFISTILSTRRGRNNCIVSNHRCFLLLKWMALSRLKQQIYKLVIDLKREKRKIELIKLMEIIGIFYAH